MTKTFFFLFSIFFTSITLISAQNVALVLQSRNHENDFAIRENTKITVYLSNHLKISGRLFIKNDSTIIVDDTAFSIRTIDYISANKVNHARIATGTTLLISGAVGIGVGALIANAPTTYSSNSVSSTSLTEATCSFAFCTAGCVAGVTGIVMLVSQLFNQKEFDLKSGYWSAFVAHEK